MNSSEAYNNVVIVGEDVDLIVLLIQNATDNNICFFKPGKSGESPSLFNSRSFKYQKLTPYVAFIHAFTGCDTTSCFAGKGKSQIIKTLESFEYLLPLIDSFYKCEVSHSEIAEHGKEIIVRMYGTKKENEKKSI